MKKFLTQIPFAAVAIFTAFFVLACDSAPSSENTTEYVAKVPGEFIEDADYLAGLFADNAKIILTSDASLADSAVFIIPPNKTLDLNGFALDVGGDAKLLVGGTLAVSGGTLTKSDSGLIIVDKTKKTELAAEYGIAAGSLTDSTVPTVTNGAATIGSTSEDVYIIGDFTDASAITIGTSGIVYVMGSVSAKTIANASGTLYCESLIPGTKSGSETADLTVAGKVYLTGETTIAGGKLVQWSGSFDGPGTIVVNGILQNTNTSSPNFWAAASTGKVIYNAGATAINHADADAVVYISSLTLPLAADASAATVATLGMFNLGSGASLELTKASCVVAAGTVQISVDSVLTINQTLDIKKNATLHVLNQTEQGGGLTGASLLLGGDTTVYGTLSGNDIGVGNRDGQGSLTIKDGGKVSARLLVVGKPVTVEGGGVLDIPAYGILGLDNGNDGPVILKGGAKLSVAATSAIYKHHADEGERGLPRGVQTGDESNLTITGSAPNFTIATDTTGSTATDAILGNITIKGSTSDTTAAITSTSVDDKAAGVLTVAEGETFTLFGAASAS